MISVPVATGITMMLIIYVLFLIGKVLEARLPQKQPSYISGAGAPEPSLEAKEAARLYREQNPNPFY